MKMCHSLQFSSRDILVRAAQPEKLAENLGAAEIMEDNTMGEKFR